MFTEACVVAHDSIEANDYMCPNYLNGSAQMHNLYLALKREHIMLSTDPYDAPNAIVQMWYNLPHHCFAHILPSPSE